MTTIVKAIMTCGACPSQWDAWDADGNYWYLRYRWGYGTAEWQPSSDPATWTGGEREAYSFDTGDSLDGCISLKEFCRRAGLELALTEPCPDWWDEST